MAEKSYPNPVSFRLDETYSRLLLEAAEDYDMSAGEYARRLVLDALEDSVQHQLLTQTDHLGRQLDALQDQHVAVRAEIVELRRELAKFRVEMLTCVRGILRSFESNSPEEVQDWMARKGLDS